MDSYLCPKNSFIPVGLNKLYHTILRLDLLQSTVYMLPYGFDTYSGLMGSFKHTKGLFLRFI